MEPENTLPAGDAPTPAPTTTLEPMSQSAAANLLAFDDDPESVVTPETPRAEAAPAGEEGQPEVPADESEEGAEAEPATEAEPEEELYEFEKVHGNTKFRLRDGTVVTKGEIAKSWGELQELPRRQAQLQQAVQQAQQQLQAANARLAQKEAFFNHIVPQAQQVLQAKLPQPPDPALAQSDPVEHYQRMVDYQQEMGKFRQLQQAQQAHQAQVQQAQQAQQAQQVSAYLAEQRTKLVDILPDLKDGAKRQEFGQKLSKYGTEVYGFQPQEINNVYDARLMKVINDAIKWQEHQASASKAEAVQRELVAKKVENAVPVAAPAKRTVSKDPRTARIDTLMQRAKSSGSQDDAAALLSLID
jgi:hypothetical protein